MDTKTLITEAKARFNHNSAKAQLKDKYDGKLIVAEQGGLWKASPELISTLNAFDDNFIILIDKSGIYSSKLWDFLKKPTSKNLYERYPQTK